MEKLTKLDIQELIEIVCQSKYDFNKNWKGKKEDYNLLKIQLRKFDILIGKLKELK